MLTALLLIAIGLSSISIGFQLRAQNRWHRMREDLAAHSILHGSTCKRLTEVELAARKTQLAHQRVAKKVRKLDLRVPKARLRPPPASPFELRRPAPDWEEGDYDTRRLDDHETFLPVDFRHRLW